MNFTRTMMGLVLFAVSFAYVEAAVVVYLRTIYDPIRPEAVDGARYDELFPLMTLKQLEAAGPNYFRLFATELGREAATILMLAGVAVTAAQNFRQWIARFMVVFGVWDIFFYLFLKLLIGWPASLGTWDILFLLPVPWVGPVIAPVLVAVSMIAAGGIILWRESQRRPIRFRCWHWTSIIGGGLIVIAAFCWDYLNTMAGGWPNPFHWPLFIAGETIGLAGFAAAVRTSKNVTTPDE